MKQSDIALAYAKQGIAVFPCRMNKAPATENGFLDASVDETVIRGWWRKNPNYLIGCPNRFFTVLDIDDHDVCGAGKFLTDNALRLFGKAKEVQKAVAVKTISGGSHIYFAPTEGAKRRIKILPNIDLLGEGGYVILPDQKSYVAETPLWEKIKHLPKFPLQFFEKLVIQLAPATKLSKEFKTAHKTKTPTSKSKKLTRKVAEEAAAVMEKIIDMSTSPMEKKPNSVNYKTDTITFEQTNNMYAKAESFSTDKTVMDKMVDGVLCVSAGELTSEKINTLFHTYEIQAKLGEMIGLDVPRSVNDTTLMHSVLPGHLDSRKSMGVRWSEDGSHLLIRDFSNFFSDTLNQVDYNIVRLYTTMCYKTLVPRMKAPEFVVWFLRMMVEAGIINIEPLKKKYAMPSFKGEMWKVAEGLVLLDAIKQLYNGYEESTVFADKFCSAWCGVTPSAANRAKKELHAAGYIHVDGVYDCSGGTRADGFYNTKLMSIITKDKIASINKGSEHLSEDSQMPEATEDREVSQVTLRGFSVSEPSYQLIKNFCSDYNIEDVPLRKNMFVETCTTEGLEKRNPPATDGAIVLTNLTLEVLPAMGEKGTEVLLVVGESPELEEVFYADVEGVEDENTILSDEPLIGFVICNNWQGNKLDVETLGMKFNDYVNGEISMDTFFIRYGTSESIYNYIYDGKEPEGE